MITKHKSSDTNTTPCLILTFQTLKQGQFCKSPTYHIPFLLPFPFFTFSLSNKQQCFSLFSLIRSISHRPPPPSSPPPSSSVTTIIIVLTIIAIRSSRPGLHGAADPFFSLTPPRFCSDHYHPHHHRIITDKTDWFEIPTTTELRSVLATADPFINHDNRIGRRKDGSGDDGGDQR